MAEEQINLNALVLKLKQSILRKGDIDEQLQTKIITEMNPNRFGTPVGRKTLREMQMEGIECEYIISEICEVLKANGIDDETIEKLKVVEYPQRESKPAAGAGGMVSAVKDKLFGLKK